MFIASEYEILRIILHRAWSFYHRIDPPSNGRRIYFWLLWWRLLATSESHSRWSLSCHWFRQQDIPPLRGYDPMELGLLSPTRQADIIIRDSFVPASRPHITCHLDLARSRLAWQSRNQNWFFPTRVTYVKYLTFLPAPPSSQSRYSTKLVTAAQRSPGRTTTGRITVNFSYR